MNDRSGDKARGTTWLLFWCAAVFMATMFACSYMPKDYIF
jgi:hypothetical protein